MKCRSLHIAFLGIMFLLLACSKTDVPEPEPQPYVLAVPANFPQPVPDANNPLSKEGIALGRMLFYDKRLSGNNQLSCASCHHQELAFSDGIALSNMGVAGTVLHRHSPALINMAWATNGLFWDGGSTNLESQAFGPITTADEMGQNLYELVAELKAVPDYVQRFKAAFNDSITTAGVVKALAQFQRTMISANSRYDKYVRHESGGSLSNTELQGMNLVQQKCAGCHKTDLFTDNDYHNNGIDADFTNNDLEGLYQGRFRITYNTADLGKFKTPTLRNVLLTAPYMHDGRFATISQVLDHYSSGVQFSAKLDPQMMQNSGAAGIPLSAIEKTQIIAFLSTLTDSAYITSKQLSKP